jgi:AcrR family transcriptional regulator
MTQSGRRPGRSGTREAILDAATRQFAERGYDGASMRVIAAAAGVDQKLIAYFFGSKQHLFVAAVGLPLNPAEVLPAIVAGDPARLRERLTQLLTDFLEQPELHQRMTGVVRAVAGDNDVARMIREFLSREVFALAETILGPDNGSLRANLVGSQLIGLVMARYVVQVEPLASMPAATVAEAVAPTLERYFVGPLFQLDS